MCTFGGNPLGEKKKESALGKEGKETGREESEECGIKIAGGGIASGPCAECRRWFRGEGVWGPRSHWILLAGSYWWLWESSEGAVSEGSMGRKWRQQAICNKMSRNGVLCTKDHMGRMKADYYRHKMKCQQHKRGCWEKEERRCLQQEGRQEKAGKECRAPVRSLSLQASLFSRERNMMETCTRAIVAELAGHGGQMGSFFFLIAIYLMGSLQLSYLKFP